MLTACCSQAVSKPVWHIQLLSVQWKTPDDGQRNCPKHVEFYPKNKLEKSVLLVGFIISIYHDARSPKRQILLRIFHNPQNSRYLKQDLRFKLHLQFSLTRFFTKLGPNISSTIYIFLKFMNIPLFWDVALRICTVGKHSVIPLRKPQNTLLQERLRCQRKSPLLYTHTHTHTHK